MPLRMCASAATVGCYAAMDQILFDGIAPRHPASHGRLAERTIRHAASCTFLEGRDAEVSAIGALEPNRQRRLAEWVAAIVFAQAAMRPRGDRYAEVIAGFGGDAPSTVPTGLIVHMQKVERACHAASTALAIGDDAWFPDLAFRRLGQVHSMGVTLRYACHSDPATAAWESIHNAHASLSATPRLGGGDASGALERAVAAFLNDPGMDQRTFAALFPAPADPGALDAIISRERRQYEAERRSV